MVTVEFFRFAAMFVIFAALWRFVESKLVGSDGLPGTIGKAMTVVL